MTPNMLTTQRRDDPSMRGCCSRRLWLAVLDNPISTHEERAGSGAPQHRPPVLVCGSSIGPLAAAGANPDDSVSVLYCPYLSQHSSTVYTVFDFVLYSGSAPPTHATHPQRQRSVLFPAVTTDAGRCRRRARHRETGRRQPGMRERTFLTGFDFRVVFV